MVVIGRRIIAFSVTLGALVVLLAPRTALAQSSYRLAPVGGRTTLVGGTGLAYGHDSAAAFLNPATVVRVDSLRLAFSVNFYQLSLVSAPNWYQPGAIDRSRFGDVKSDGAAINNFDFDSLPGSLCLYFKVADIKLFSGEASKDLRERQARLGMCLASVQNGIYSYNDEGYSQSGPFGVSRQAGSIRQSFRRFAIGPTYSMYVSNALAVGASIHFSRSSLRSTIGNTATLYGASTPFTSALYQASRGDSHGLTMTLGATYRIGSRQTVALALETPSLHLFGSGGVNNYTSFDGPGERGTSGVAASGEFETQTPLRVSLGTGIEGSWGSAEINVAFHTAVGSAYSAKLDGRSINSDGTTTTDRAVSLDLSTRARGAVNFGVGGEYFFTPGLSLLGGLSTDISAVPGGALGKDPLNFYPDNVSRVAGSLGIGSHGDGGDLLLGGEFSYGWGQRLAPNAYQAPSRIETTDVTAYAVLLVLAGSTSLKNIKRAVEDVRDAFDPSAPPKTPATKPAAPGPTNPSNPKDDLPKAGAPRDIIPPLDPPGRPPKKEPKKEPKK